MDLNDQLELEHLLFFDRKCRVCKKVKSLMDDFYLTRKNRSTFVSAYSYECKDCTIKRITEDRRSKEIFTKWEYPDW
jgi:hypothetical protein